MDSSNCLSYKRLVILHKLRCANCVTKILYFFIPPNFQFPFFRILSSHGFSSCPEFSNFRIFVFTRNITDSHGFSFSFLVPNYRIIEFLSSHGISRTVTDFLFFLLVTNFRIIEFQSHGISRTVTDFSFLSRIRELSNFCLP